MHNLLYNLAFVCYIVEQNGRIRWFFTEIFVGFFWTIRWGVEEIIAAIEADGEGFYDITMDVTKNKTEHQLISSKNSLIEHPMTLVAEAVTNNNNNSVGTGPVNFEAASGNTQRFKKLTEEDLKAI